MKVINGSLSALLIEVRGRIEAAGLALRDGILAADSESLEGTLD